MGVFQWMVSLGLGKHLWDVPLENYSPNFLRAWLTVAVLYSACMLTMKLSVLMLYRRLFPIQNFRLQWWCAVAFVNAYSVMFIFASLFSCSPISAAWYVSTHIHLDASTYKNQGRFYIRIKMYQPISAIYRLHRHEQSQHLVDPTHAHANRLEPRLEERPKIPSHFSLRPRLITLRDEYSPTKSPR
jgi:hypothetical protein